MNYKQATRLDLVNSYSAKISYAALILRPFYVFNYVVDVKRRLLIGRGLHKEGTHIVDAMTGEILEPIKQSQRFNPIHFSQKAIYIQKIQMKY